MNKQLIKDPFDYLLPYIVSIGPKDETPIGSGTLIQFSVELDQKNINVYCILTATHILEELGLLDVLRPKAELNKYITLSKPIDRLGNVCSVLWKIGCATELDKKHYRYLIQNHYDPRQNFYTHSERDIGLGILGVGDLPQNNITENSLFYNVDTVQLNLLLPERFNYVFYQGACREEKNNVLVNTGIRILPHGTVKIMRKSQLTYYDNPANNLDCIKGSSGAGLWIFYTTKDDTIDMALRGIIVEKKEDYKRHRIYAIDISHIKQLVDKIKKMIIKNWPI